MALHIPSVFAYLRDKEQLLPCIPLIGKKNSLYEILVSVFLAFICREKISFPLQRPEQGITHREECLLLWRSILSGLSIGVDGFCFLTYLLPTLLSSIHNLVFYRHPKPTAQKIPRDTRLLPPEIRDIGVRTQQRRQKMLRTYLILSCPQMICIVPGKGIPHLLGVFARNE